MQKMIKYATAFSFNLICVLLTLFDARAVTIPGGTTAGALSGAVFGGPAAGAATGLIGEGKSVEGPAGPLSSFA
jgi:hypothetical protein